MQTRDPLKLALSLVRHALHYAANIAPEKYKDLKNRKPEEFKVINATLKCNNFSAKFMLKDENGQGEFMRFYSENYLSSFFLGTAEGGNINLHLNIKDDLLSDIEQKTYNFRKNSAEEKLTEIPAAPSAPSAEEEKKYQPLSSLNSDAVSIAAMIARASRKPVPNAARVSEERTQRKIFCPIL